jgi:pyruvate dehydrogenase E1 component beta subunit
VRDAFAELQAPPFRITTPNVPVPYSKELEARFLLGSDEVGRQIGAFLQSGQVPSPWWQEEGIVR